MQKPLSSSLVTQSPFLFLSTVSSVVAETQESSWMLKKSSQLRLVSPKSERYTSPNPVRRRVTRQPLQMKNYAHSISSFLFSSFSIFLCFLYFSLFTLLTKTLKIHK